MTTWLAPFQGSIDPPPSLPPGDGGSASAWERPRGPRGLFQPPRAHPRSALRGAGPAAQGAACRARAVRGAGPGARFSGKECLARRGRRRPRLCEPPPSRASFPWLPGSLATKRPPPRRRPAPACLRQSWGAPPSQPGCAGARPSPSLPLPSPAITQKLVKLVPDSWRRAPLQERKKGKRKRKKPARARQRASEARGAKRTPRVLSAPPAPRTPNSCLGPRLGWGEGAGDMDPLFMVESII